MAGLYLPETADMETSSDDYARRFNGKIGKYFLDVQEKITLNLLKTWPGTRLLDVGGGHAQLAVPLVRQGFDVTVVGSSECCKRRLEDLLPQGSYQFHACNLLSLPFENESFQVALAFRLLPHVSNWKTLLAEMCRVAKEAVIVDYPDLVSFNIMSKTFFQTKKAIEGNTRPYRCFSRLELLKEFTKNGFRESAIRPEFFIPMVVHRALGFLWVSKALESASRGLGMTRIFGSPVVLRASRLDLKT